MPDQILTPRSFRNRPRTDHAQSGDIMTLSRMVDGTAVTMSISYDDLMKGIISSVNESREELVAAAAEDRLNLNKAVADLREEARRNNDQDEAIQDQVDKLSAMDTEVNNRLDLVDQKITLIAAIEETLATLQQAIAQDSASDADIQQTLTGIQQDMQAAGMQVAFLSSALSQFETDVSTGQSAQNLRLNTLESTSATHTGAIAAIVTANTAQDAALTGIQAKDLLQDASISAVMAKNDQQDTSIGAIQAKDSSQDTYISALGGRLNALEASQVAQDTSIAAAIAKNTAQDTTIASIQTNATALAATITALQSTVSSIQTALAGKVTLADLGVWTVSQNALIAIAAGSRTVELTGITGLLKDDKVLAFIVPTVALPNGMPAGYLLAANPVAKANSTLEVTLDAPLLAIGASYAIQFHIYALR